MRPGKTPTPRPVLNLKRLWHKLQEKPPGPILTVVSVRKSPAPKSDEASAP